jgi:polysaccharide biosynthesis protein PslH
MLRAVSRRLRTRLVVPVRPGEESAVDQLRQLGCQVCPVPVQKRSASSESRRLVGSVLRRQPYVMYRRHFDASVLECLQRECQQEPPDLLYLDHPDSFAYHAGLSSRPFVMDLHNVYSVLLARTANERRGPARWFLRREATLLKKMEAKISAKAEALFCVSDGDASYYRKLGDCPVHVVPNGVDCSIYSALPTGRDASSPLILFLGAMSWEPNVNAAVFLAHDVLPRLRSRLPNVRLRIVGRDPARAVQELAHISNVEVTGTVPSVMPHLAEASMLAVPLEAGGGTRLKILEAFAAGLPVVSTPVGCEGLEVRHHEHLIVAERGNFAEAVHAVLSSPGLGCSLAESARRLVRQQYDWEGITDRVCNLLEEIRVGT